MPLLFALTLFCSALLLFQVQPMVGKMLLPKLGGTPAVWNACMVFFQAALLAGYGYAHAASSWLGTRRQALLHLPILLLPALVLPIAIADDAFHSAVATEHPALLVLAQLTMTVGLPFFVVSTTAPLLQRWFAETGHRSARDPYFLYAASNLGSMLALLAYPLAVEPLLPLGRQSQAWSWAYAGYAALVAACAFALWRYRAGPAPASEEAEKTAERIPWARRLRWITLAFVPSSTLLGTTTYISTDIAPIPLLWIIPLALYLLTFILVFASKPPIPHALMCRVLPACVLIVTLILLVGATEMQLLPIWVLPSLHLLAFFVVAMVGHGELAKDRPSAKHLTEFYLLMSVGGVLGGMFNALLAPVLFRHTGLTEYPLILVLACLIRPVPRRAGSVSDRSSETHKPPVAHAPGSPVWDFLLPAAVALLALALILLADYLGLQGPLRTALAFGLPCLLVYTFVDRPRRFGFGIAALLLAGAFNPQEQRLYLERNFFGVVKVAEIHPAQGGHFRALFHGNTIHGQMDLTRTDPEGRHVPLTYYHPTGPIGQVCTRFFKSRPAGQRVGAVGLGTGSIAYYARPGDSWTFYEIDPVIQRVAEDSRYFNFMSECRAGPPKVVLGDAYLRLQEEPDAAFDLLVLDAFSSDAIPVHLLTREAMRLYQAKLRPGGVLAFHVSNRYLNLQPILARLAEDAGLAARGWYDTADDPAAGKYMSIWVIMARSEDDYAGIVWPNGRAQKVTFWEPIRPDPGTPLWTNDFSNLLSAFGRVGRSED